MLGKLLVLGCPTNLDVVGQGPSAFAVGVGGGCLDILSSPGQSLGRAIVLPPASALASALAKSLMLKFFM